MNRATFLELMDKYLDGTLPESELKDFELLLKNDPLLQKELNIHKNIRRGIILHGRNLIAEDLSLIKEEINQEIYKNRVRIRHKIEDSPNLNDDYNTSVEIPFEKETKKSPWLKNISKWLLASAAIFILIVSSIIIFKYSESNALTETYIGEYAVKVYPKEGNLGAPGNIFFHISSLKSKLDVYEFKEDTIILYTKNNPIDIKNKKAPVIILNEKRYLIIETENQKQIFKPKK